MIRTVIIAGLGMALVPTDVRADLIDFENLTGPQGFTGPAQTVTYSFPDGITATFSGGQILTNVGGPHTDSSSVYATIRDFTSFTDPSLTNPITVTFNHSIQNLQIQILNGLAGSYTMTDDQGNMTQFNLAIKGGSVATEGFAVTGGTVSILYTGLPGLSTTWSFAIDNITFEVPGPIVGTGLPGLLSLFVAWLLRCRRCRKEHGIIHFNGGFGCKAGEK